MKATRKSAPDETRLWWAKQQTDAELVEWLGFFAKHGIFCGHVKQELLHRLRDAQGKDGE